jgi:hypothetical protein
MNTAPVRDAPRSRKCQCVVTETRFYGTGARGSSTEAGIVGSAPVGRGVGPRSHGAGLPWRVSLALGEEPHRGDSS